MTLKKWIYIPNYFPFLLYIYCMKLEGFATKENTCSYWADGCVKRTHVLLTQNLLSNIYSLAVNNEIVVVIAEDLSIKFK